MAETEIQEQSETEAARVALRHREGMEWYVVHTYSGFEKKVKESLTQRVEAYGMQDEFGDILIPTEDVVEMKGGRKVISQKKYFPGYVLVQMRMGDNAWHLVRNTPKVTAFIGEHRPTPLSREDVDNIVRQVTSAAEKPKPKFVFEKGDQIRVIDGPFRNFTGVVEEVNPVKCELTLMVSILGRATPVKLDFLQVEKI